MTTYPLAPLAYANDAIHRRTIAQTTNNAISGKLNVLSTLTLNSSATSTTLNDSRITPTNVILFVPTNADSLTAWKNGVYASAQGIGTATITHSSNAANDQNIQSSDYRLGVYGEFLRSIFIKSTRPNTNGSNSDDKYGT